MKKLLGGCLALFAAAMHCASAAPIVYGFDTFADGTVVTNQISGLTFTNTTAISAGLSLNELEFPPRSGAGVVFDDGGAIAIDFASPVFSVGGYFTYVVGLTFSAYDSGNNLLGSLLAAFGSNVALSGDVGSAPNEFVSLNSATGAISRVVITGDPLGGSFTLDDLTVDAGTASAPEPQTLILMLALLGVGCLRGGWLRRAS